MPRAADRPHRRQFVRVVALGGASGAVVSPRSTHGRDDAKPPDEPKPPDEVDARMGMILSRFGAVLDDEARAVVRRDVETVVRRGEALRNFPLDNGDAPMPVFRAFRAALDAGGPSG